MVKIIIIGENSEFRYEKVNNHDFLGGAGVKIYSFKMTFCENCVEHTVFGQYCDFFSEHFEFK